jgi:hypothetical protein
VKSYCKKKIPPIKIPCHLKFTDFSATIIQTLNYFQLADEFLVGNNKQVEPTKLIADLLQQPQLPASISTDQLNELLVRYMLETNQQPRMDASQFVVSILRNSY